MIYIDDSRIPYRGMIMSHMAADTLKELHGMADKLGLRKYFQDKPGKPHYDICQQKKIEAIRSGYAVEIKRREFIHKVKNMQILCHRCGDNGWYFVDEWIGNLQGRQDCNCETEKQLIGVN